jgi:hypothetical protein
MVDKQRRYLALAFLAQGVFCAQQVLYAEIRDMDAKRDVHIEIQVEQEYLIPGPVIVAMTVCNRGSQPVEIPGYCDITYLRNQASFDVVDSETAEVIELRRPTHQDFFERSEGVGGPTRAPTISLKPGEDRRTLIDLSEFPEFNTLSPGEHLLIAKVYSYPNRIWMSSRPVPLAIRQTADKATGFPVDHLSWKQIVLSRDWRSDEFSAPKCGDQLEFYKIWSSALTCGDCSSRAGGGRAGLVQSRLM